MKLGPYDLDSIVAGECAGLMDAMPEGCIDLTVTSPPYDNLREYQGYVFDFEAIARQLWRVTKPGGVVVWVVGDATINGSETGTSFRQALYFMQLGFNLHDTMIYHKQGGNFTPTNRYYSVFEYMFVLSKGIPKTFNPIQVPRTGHVYHSVGTVKRGNKKHIDYDKTRETRNADNVWVIAAHSKNASSDEIAYLHPAIFPEKLAHDHILSWSNPGDIVFDPMVGSGTTCKMAKELGRHWLGFDISPEYVEIARKRVGLAKTPLFIA